MWIDHRRQILKPTIRALALHQSKSSASEPDNYTMANSDYQLSCPNYLLIPSTDAALYFFVFVVVVVVFFYLTPIENNYQFVSLQEMVHMGR